MACLDGEIKSGKLLIRRDGLDVGARPIDPCTNYWSSPDLYLTGGPSRTQARQGVAHTINVQVTNISNQPIADIAIEAWVCDFTAGPLPTGQLTPPGRVTGSFAGPLNPGGVSPPIACSPTWTPSATQAAMNGGHLCLGANVYAAAPADGAMLPAGGTLKMCCDSHHAQCNIGVISAGAGGGQMQIWVRAPESQKVMPMLVEIQPVTGKVGFGLAERRLLRSDHKLGKLPITLSRTKPTKFVLEAAGHPASSKLELRPDAKRGVELQIHVGTDRMAKHTMQLYDVTTRDPRTHDVIGGARLLVVRR